jgi:hypothetical protein
MDRRRRRIALGRRAAPSPDALARSGRDAVTMDTARGIVYRASSAPLRAPGVADLATCVTSTTRRPTGTLPVAGAGHRPSGNTGVRRSGSRDAESKACFGRSRYMGSFVA